jgi:hypothetical protein
MSTQFENYSVSEINFIEPVGNDLGDLGTYSLTLTPDAGYTINADVFNLITPVPSGITNTSFNQAGPNVQFNFEFSNGTIMPANDIEFPLCFQGYAELANFIIQGSVDIATTNATPLPQLVPYSNSGPYNSSEVVYTQTILADSNYYFFVEPTASLAVGDPNAYNITSSKTFGGPNGELTAVTFSVEYTYPAENVSSDLINIVGSAIPIIVPTQLINAFNFNGATGYNFTVNSAGAVRDLNLIGDPNAVYSVSLFDNLGNETVYATNQVMGATGTATIPGITIPSSAAGNPPYELIISGEINPAITNVGDTIVVDILQQEPVFIEITATTTDANLTIAGVPDVLNFNANTDYAPGAEPVLNFSFTATSTTGEITQIAPVTANSFAPVIPDPLEIDYIYNISNLTSALTDSNTIFTVSGTIEVYSSGATPITHVLDLDNILQTIELPTIVTKGITNETGTEADSGGESITDGGGTISSKGIQWSEFADFNTILGANDEGTGTADFTSTITGLTPGNTYYVRAYAQNEAGVAYGQVIGFVSNITIPCSSTASPGGAGITDTNINLDSGGGLIAILFDPEGVPDKLEIIHGGPDGTKVATSGFDNGTDGNAGPFDNVYGTEPSNTVPTAAQVASIDQFIGTNKGVAPTRQIQFENETGYQVTNMTIGGTAYQQIVWWQYDAADWQTAPNVTVRVTGATGTQWTYLRLCCPDANCTTAPTP